MKVVFCVAVVASSRRRSRAPARHAAFIAGGDSSRVNGIKNNHFAGGASPWPTYLSSAALTIAGIEACLSELISLRDALRGRRIKANNDIHRLPCRSRVVEMASKPSSEVKRRRRRTSGLATRGARGRQAKMRAASENEGR